MNTSSITNGGISGGRSVLSSAGGRFGDNPFLNLLVTQMRSQTPLDPVDNGNFMQQLASFSSMEEQKQINDNLLQLLDFQGALARVQGLGEASSLLGTEVTWMEGDVEQSGVVDGVFIDDQGDVRLRIGEGDISMRAVTGVRRQGTQES